MREPKRKPCIVLSPGQQTKYQLLRELGHTYGQARYRVLTEEQRRDLCKRAWASQQRTYKRDPYEEIMRKARNSAKKRGLDFEITADDLDWPDICPVLGIKLHYPGRFQRDPAGASLDRQNNKEGYVEGNVIVVSWRANSLRNNATTEELFKLAKFYVPTDYSPHRLIYEGLHYDETDPPWGED